MKSIVAEQSESTRETFVDKKWPPFDEAVLIAVASGFKSQLDWRAKIYKVKALGLPSRPDQVYKKEWKGWKFFLSGVEQQEKMTFLEAKEFCRKVGFLNGGDYVRRYKTISKRLPSEPFKQYSDEWKGWPDYLGCPDYSTRNKTFISFPEAKQLAFVNDIKSQLEWREFTKTDLFRKANCPADPSHIYRNDWISWSDFLQVERRRIKRLLPFEESHKIALNLKLKSRSEWISSWQELNLFSQGVPQDPRQAYKEWISWRHWLGHDRETSTKAKSKRFLSFEDARSLARSFKLQSVIEWKQFAKSDRFIQYEHLIPRAPQIKYRKNGWVSWSDWIGRDNLLAKEIYKYDSDNFSVELFIKRRPEGFYPEITSAQEIMDLKRTARRLTIETGIRHSIDHKDPVSHPLVCGLHVLANLEVIPLRQNIRKSNSFTPYGIDSTGRKYEIDV